MTKQTKMLLGVGVLAAAGYLLYKQQSKPKVTANFKGMDVFGGCCGTEQTPVPKGQVGAGTYKCCDGLTFRVNKGKDCSGCPTA
jgi:hypothetical protein